jgi:uncharacterized protein with HEPN domain
VSSRQWQDRVRDILEAIEEITRFTEDLEEQAFSEDPKTRKAVLADFAIIGEAAGAVPEEVRSAHPTVPWRSMRAMRNLVIHAYFQVEATIVWETIQRDLPPLAAQLRAVLDEESSA